MKILGNKNLASVDLSHKLEYFFTVDHRLYILEFSTSN